VRSEGSQLPFDALQQLRGADIEHFRQIKQCGQGRTLLASFHLADIVAVVSSPVSERILRVSSLFSELSKDNSERSLWSLRFPATMGDAGHPPNDRLLDYNCATHL